MRKNTKKYKRELVAAKADIKRLLSEEHLPCEFCRYEAQMDVPCTQGDKEWCRQKMQSGKEYQMDEKDAISILNMIEAHGALPVKAKEMAINAIEEVQQYRAIGTPKKIKDLLEKAAEEIENLYGRETQLSEEIRKSLDS